jgi:hypothetical protein
LWCVSLRSRWRCRLQGSAASVPPPESTGLPAGVTLTANNGVHLHVVRFLRNFGNSLKLKTDADLDRGCGNRGEKSIVKSGAPAESTSLGGKCQPGHEDEIQLRQSGACHRFADPKSTVHKFREGRNRAKQERAAFASRVADQMRGRQVEIPQKIQVGFRGCRGEQCENLLSEIEGVKLFANPKRSPLPFAWRDCPQLFAYALSPAGFLGKWRSGIYHCDVIQ